MVCLMAGSPLTARRRRWTASPRSDVVLALLLGVVCLQSAFGEHGLKQPGWAVVLLIELSVLPLALRRSRPLAVLRHQTDHKPTGCRALPSRVARTT